VACGVACRHLGPEGCVLGDLKGPLCVSYLCEGVRGQLAAIAGWDAVGQDTDDFAGALRALRAAVRAELAEAEKEVAELEDRLAALRDGLGRWEAEAGMSPYEAYTSSENGSRPSRSTR
jgi:hypothetical protein